MQKSSSKASVGAFMKEFLKKESAGGIILMLAAVVAIIFANSGLAR